ncbi:14882_t:CDS:1 [Dentiscutata erythropus]|uniref:14882_t:CDS:1 n=1 Tax=Dentiscutata erythropus TaxID=1348616 RepID=A0A9N9DNA2_9GLOM|nr:14882_t:CDS:1 [Dentiscutata erythropus]
MNPIKTKGQIKKEKDREWQKSNRTDVKFHKIEKIKTKQHMRALCKKQKLKKTIYYFSKDEQAKTADISFRVLELNEEFGKSNKTYSDWPQIVDKHCKKCFI